MVEKDLTPLIKQIHARSCPLVLAVTGGGSGAISTLLRVPGASRTVLEAGVYYAAESLTQWLGSRPENFCSSRTVRAMAMIAYQRARQLTAERKPSPAIAGVACTASLASDRPKRGDHRAHIAWQTRATTWAAEIVLRKGHRSRGEEEDLVAHLLLIATDEATATSYLPLTMGDGTTISQIRSVLGLLDDERFSIIRQDAPRDWQALVAGECDAVGRGPGEKTQPASMPRTIFPGAFNPRHAGHLVMADVAGRSLNRPVEFELSVTNVDKPPLDYIEMAAREAQFAADDTVWFTRAPTFVEKSGVFPGSVFVVGADTVVRIGEPRYYEGNSSAAQQASRDEAIASIASRGCRFLVFGRRRDGDFQSLETIAIPDSLRALCDGVLESEFRADISSTELRRSAKSESSE